MESSGSLSPTWMLSKSSMFSASLRWRSLSFTIFQNAPLSFSSRFQPAKSFWALLIRSGLSSTTRWPIARMFSNDFLSPRLVSRNPPEVSRTRSRRPSSMSDFSALSFRKVLAASLAGLSMELLVLNCCIALLRISLRVSLPPAWRTMVSHAAACSVKFSNDSIMFAWNSDWSPAQALVSETDGSFLVPNLPTTPPTQSSTSIMTSQYLFVHSSRFASLGSKLVSGASEVLSGNCAAERPTASRVRFRAADSVSEMPNRDCRIASACTSESVVSRFSLLADFTLKPGRMDGAPRSRRHPRGHHRCLMPGAAVRLDRGSSGAGTR